MAEFTQNIMKLSDRVGGSTVDIDPWAHGGNFALLSNQHLILSWQAQDHASFCVQRRFGVGDVLLRGTMLEDDLGIGMDVDFRNSLHRKDMMPGNHELEFLKYWIEPDLSMFLENVFATRYK